jgi:hypothetical protein
MSNVQTETRLSAEDKAQRAAMWATCPEWCNGATHDEGNTDHVAEVGSVGPVSVAVEQRGDVVRVLVVAEDFGNDGLDADGVVSLVAMLEQAGAMLREITA